MHSASSLRPALVLLLGAAALAVARLTFGVTFDVTPLAVGVIALAAAAVGPSPKAWTTGLVLTAWGAGVWLVRQGPLPDREAPVFMIAVAVGLLLAVAAAPSARQSEVARGGALTILGGGVLFYLAYDVAWLTEWWVFAAGLAVAAIAEAARGAGRGSGRRS